MKPIILKSTLCVVITLLMAVGVNAQRTITGTVYLKGKPASGITVEAHKGSSMMTSFDGKYKVQADPKSKWLRFTELATGESKKYDLDENSGDSIDFYFDGIKPVKGTSTGGVSNKSWEQLKNDKDFNRDYSLYDGFYQQKDYKSAYPYWQKIYDKYPKSTRNIYIQGINMVNSFLKDATTPEEQEKYLQKEMEIYDKRIKNFGDKGKVLGRKGVSWFDYYITRLDNLSDERRKEVLKKGYEWLSESVKEEGANTETAVLVLFLQSSAALFHQYNELPKETVVQNYQLCTKYLNEKISGDDKGKVARAKQAQPYVEKIFEDSGAADCDALIKIYTPQFQEKSGDVEFLKEMLRKLVNADCKESDLFNKASIKLYDLEPSPEAAFNLAETFVKKGDIEKAKDYFKQAMDQETDKDKLATYYYQYALLLYKNDKDYQKAREYARKALAINPKYCQALVLIGDIYVTVEKNFDKDDFKKSAVFWVAVDYYNKAASAGGACAANAAAKAATYKAYFPKKADAFFYNVLEGQNYTVGGWINETTKVRFN